MVALAALVLVAATPPAWAASGSPQEGALEREASSEAERDYLAVSAPVACPGVQLDVVFPLAPGAACFAVGSAGEALVRLDDAAPWLVSGTLAFYDLALSPVGDAQDFCHQEALPVPPDAGYLQVRVHGALDESGACPSDSGGPATKGTIEASFSA